MEMVCPICKATFTLTDAEKKRGRKKTCSRECSYALRGLQGRSRVAVNCAKCGCVLSKTPSQVYGASYCDGCKSDRVQPFPVGHRCHGWTVISAEAVKEAKVYWQKCRCECSFSKELSGQIGETSLIVYERKGWLPGAVGRNLDIFI